MATFLELQDEVLAMIGRNMLAGGDDFRARVKFHVNRAYIALTSAIDIPDLAKDSPAIASVASQQAYAIPSDCLFIHSITFDYDTVNSVALEKVGIKSLDSMGTKEAAIPKYYARHINNFHVAEIPNVIKNMRVRYYSQPVELSADGDVPVTRREWDFAILLLASQYVAIATNKLDSATAWLTQFQAYISMMRIPYHSLTMGADEGIEISGANPELANRGAPGTIPKLGISGPTASR